MNGNGFQQLRPQRVSVPIVGCRTWTTALALNPEGDWSFIAQFYEYPRPEPTQYVVVDLRPDPQAPEYHRCSVSDWQADQRSPGHASYTTANNLYGVFRTDKGQEIDQVRAANGRIFFAEDASSISYYDPMTRTVRHKEGVLNIHHDRIIHTFIFGFDGKLYGGTQSREKILPAIVWIDPETLETAVLGAVGRDRPSISFAYNLAADRNPDPKRREEPYWIYVAVGHEPWQLTAIHARTREVRFLQQLDGASGLSFELESPTNKTGVIAKFSIGKKAVRFWCADGESFPYEKGRQAPFPPRPVKPQTYDVPAGRAPLMDLSALPADAVGRSHLKWTLKGTPDSATIPDGRPGSVKIRAYPIQIEMLLGVPDAGLLLGKAEDYGRFFRHLPGQTGTTVEEHPPDISDAVGAAWGREVYVAGYPSSGLYRYDVSQPAPQPQLIDYFAPDQSELSGIHYPKVLIPDGTRLYFCGRGRTDEDGGAVAYYDRSPGSKEPFRRRRAGLKSLVPAGMLLLGEPDRPEMSRLVYAGQWVGTARNERQGPVGRLLVFYDGNLERKGDHSLQPPDRAQPLREPLARRPNAGRLFHVPEQPYQFLGLIRNQKWLYSCTYDASGEAPDGTVSAQIDWYDLSGVGGREAEIGASCVRTSDQSIWAMFGDLLVQIVPRVPATGRPQVLEIGTIDRPVHVMEWLGRDLYLAVPGLLPGIQPPQWDTQAAELHVLRDPAPA